jgi:hypothetical protein
MEPDCVIAFHDANLIFDALYNIETYLAFSERRHLGLYLAEHMYAVAIGDLTQAFEPMRRYAQDPETYIARSRESLQREVAMNVVNIRAA